MRENPRNDQPRGVSCLVGVVLPIEVGRRKILGTVEGKFSVPPKHAGGGGEPLDIAAQALRQSVPLGQQHFGHVVHARRVDAGGTQQSLQGEFDNLLRFPHNVSPAPGLVENIDGAQAYRGASDIICGEGLIAHQAFSIQ